MIVLDSMGGNKNTAVRNIRHYLSAEWKAKMCGEEGDENEYEFTRKEMKTVRPQKPEQENYSDCGIYLLHYIEMMFKSVTQFYWPGSIQNLSNWFTTEEISTKREAIARLIRDLSTEQNMEIIFPDDHLRSKHESGKIEKKHDFWCGLCRKGFETENKLEDHEKLELCGVDVSEMEMFKIHQSQLNNVPCYLDSCDRRFQHKKELLSHLKTQHSVVQIRIGNDSEEQHRGYLTTERSQANIDLAEWAESWINSPLAVEHMKKVMKGVVKSRRHDLFLDKKERDQCSGSETSMLNQLSNPGFLGGGGEKDTVVIKHLIDRVFMKFFHEADPKLMELGTETAFVYTSCVLFPETFIHQHQVQGKSKEDAEQTFMEVVVDEDERKGLNQEIKEAAVKNRRDNEEDSGDEWVNHSDMEDDLDE